MEGKTLTMRMPLLILYDRRDVIPVHHLSDIAITKSIEQLWNISNP